MIFLHKIFKKYDGTDATLEILLMLLVAFILGWLLKHILDGGLRDKIKFLEDENERIRRENEELNSRLSILDEELTSCEERNNSFKIELDECLKRKATTVDTSEIESLKAKIIRLEAALDEAQNSNTSRDGNMAFAAFAPTAPGDKPSKVDDLKKIEGIGPKIEGLCNDIGIYSFEQMAFTTTDTLKKMLEDAGSRFKMHDPTTWPAQAHLAANEKWDQLKAWQDVLDGGRM